MMGLLLTEYYTSSCKIYTYREIMIQEAGKGQLAFLLSTCAFSQRKVATLRSSGEAGLNC